MIDRRQFLAALAAVTAEITKRSATSSTRKEKAARQGAIRNSDQGDSKLCDFESPNLRVRLFASGGLDRIENIESGEVYKFSRDRFSIVTNKGTFNSTDRKPETRKDDSGLISYLFINEGQYNVSLNYRLGASGHYIERWVALENVAIPLELIKVSHSWTNTELPPQQAFKYDTFWNTPTTVFLRWSKGGLFTGIENPFFESVFQNRAVSLSFEPSLLLAAGDTYSSEPQFIGVYKRNGKVVTDHYLPTLTLERPHMMRFRNPSGHIPLDWNEIQGMRQFVLDYLHPKSDRFLCSLYMYWYPIEQLWSLNGSNPTSDALVEEKYKRIVSNFSELGGDLIIFNPLFKYSRPHRNSDSYWDVAPQGSAASRVLEFAQKKGIECGFYMGVAAHGDEGNACALPFAPEEPTWKKVDFAGGQSGENCIACEGFANWWYEVQRNTISKFDLRYWSWDPGPGNGSFCYSANHGHIPGKGAYKGWREATRLTERLKSEFPELILMAFYGRKESGLWGLKNFDLQESYWEQTILYGATKHPDLHDDRINADGARFQSWWNENFRFLPTAMNHPLIHRIGENSYDSRLPKAWDYLGWRYAVMSAIATSGSVFPCILPEDLSNVPEFTAFYQKWLGWARKNSEYVRYNRSLGDQVRPGGIDIHVRIREDHGFIFLCNPGPRPTRTNFELGEAIGLKPKGSFKLKELYPKEERFYYDSFHDRGVYQTGDTISVIVPEYEVMLLELSRFDIGDLPLVFGVSGKVQRSDAGVAFDGLDAQPGEVVELVMLPGEQHRDEAVSINQKPVKLESRRNYQHARLKFAGAPLSRALDDWRTSDGSRFKFPFHEHQSDLRLYTKFFLSASVRGILERAVPPNLPEYQSLLESWRESYPHNFTWARPDRLWFVLPFVDPDHVENATMRCNGKDVELQWFAPCDRPKGSRIIAYADITDAANFGSDNQIDLQLSELQMDQFLGPFLDYPLDAPVQDWEVSSLQEAGRVVYEQPIDAEMPSRLATSIHPAPRVRYVELTPRSTSPEGKQMVIAEIDVVAERLQNVWVSIGPSGEAAMSWDKRRKRWVYEWTAPTRVQDILDAEYAFVWAVSREGIVSEPFKIALRWLLTKQ